MSKINKTKKTLCYLPTFRDKKELLFLGEKSKSKIINFLNFLNENNYQLITKLHFAGTNIVNREKDILYKYKNIIILPSQMDIYPFLKYSDILITDYSSVYFDFLYLNRDIIFYPYDLTYYKLYDRGLLFEYNKITPGDKVFNLNELTDNLKLKLKLVKKIDMNIFYLFF